MHVLAYDELERADQRRLHCGDIHFAVALARMPVARLEERAFDVNWDEELRPFDQILVVEIACVSPGRSTVDPARRLRRRHAQAAEKRAQWNLDPWREPRQVAFPVERDNLGPAAGEIALRQDSA